MVPLVLLVPPPWAGLTAAALPLLVQARTLRSPTVRRVCNAALCGLCAHLVALTAAAVAGSPPWSAPLDAVALGSSRGVAALAAALVVDLALQNLLVAGVLRLNGASDPWWRLTLVEVERTADLGVWGLGILLTGAWTVHPLLTAAGLPVVLLVQRSLVHEQLQRQATTDAKTGLATSAAWRTAAEAALRRGGRDRVSCGLLVVDLDHVKRVNDEHGHLVGDEVLRAVAAALLACARPGDLVGRFGGDEFVVLLPGADAAAATAVAERVRSAVAAVRVDGVPGAAGVRASASVGAAAGTGVDLPVLLGLADQALLAGKGSGRGRAVTARAWEPVG